MDELVYVYDTRTGNKLPLPVSHATLDADPNLKRVASQEPVVLVDGNYRPVGYRSPNAGALVDGKPAPAPDAVAEPAAKKRTGGAVRVQEPAPTPQAPPSAADKSTTPTSGPAAQIQED